MDFTFGITTGGEESAFMPIAEIISSIQLLNIPHYEIIIIGGNGDMFPPPSSFHLTQIPFDESQKPLWITRKKNLITQNAYYENIVYLHDYVRFEPAWYDGFLSFGQDFKACMTPITNFDGTRYRDWTLDRCTPLVRQAVMNNGLNFMSDLQLPYSETELSRFMYFSGAYWVAKKSIMQEFPLNEDLVWGQGEDINWSQRFRQKYAFSMNPFSPVKLMKSKENTFCEIPQHRLPAIKKSLLESVKMHSKKMAVIIPYRDRAEHLKEFVPKLKEFIGDSIPYTIWVVEQGDAEKFNRAKLLNIGFALAKDSADYFAFHDVDMVPLESDYSYPDTPTHLATAAEQNNWTMPYDGYFGGVTLFNKADFEKINGYSNNYFGYGAEDDDLLFRCMGNNVPVNRRHGKYRCMPHDRNFNGLDQNRQKYYGLITGQTDFNSTKEDGLNSLKFEEISRITTPDYIQVKCKI